MKRMLRFLLLVVSAFVVGLAQATSIPKLQDQLYYLDPAGQDWVFVEANPERPLLAQFKGRKHQIPSPTRLGTITGIGPSGSQIWACVIEEPPTGARMVVLRWELDRPEQGWTRVGEVEEGHGVPSLLLPLQHEGHFLGVANGFGFVDGDRSGPSFAARFRFREGKFQFEECVDMAFKEVGGIAKVVPLRDVVAALGKEVPEPLKEETAVPVGPATICVVDPPTLEPSLWCPSISRDHLSLCAPRAGVAWVFELGKGTLRRTFNLEGLKKEELKKVRLLNLSILGTSFDPLGRLIVAKRDPELFQISLRLAREAADPVDLQMQKQDFQMFTDLFRDIHWVRLDPETGQHQELSSPTDHPADTPSFRMQDFLRFLVTPQGQVRTNAYRNWEFVKRDFGVSAEAIPYEESGPPDKNQIKDGKLPPKLPAEKVEGRPK